MKLTNGEFSIPCETVCYSSSWNCIEFICIELECKVFATFIISCIIFKLVGPGLLLQQHSMLLPFSCVIVSVTIQGFAFKRQGQVACITTERVTSQGGSIFQGHPWRRQHWRRQQRCSKDVTRVSIHRIYLTWRARISRFSRTTAWHWKCCHQMLLAIDAKGKRNTNSFCFSRWFFFSWTNTWSKVFDISLSLSGCVLCVCVWVSACVRRPVCVSLCVPMCV